MNRKGASAFLAAACLLLLSGSARADVVYLNDGTELEGQIVGDHPSHVVLLVRGRQISLRKQDIDTIQIEKPKTRADVVALPPKPSPAAPAGRASAAGSAAEKPPGDTAAGKSEDKTEKGKPSAEKAGGETAAGTAWREGAEAERKEETKKAEPSDKGEPIEKASRAAGEALSEEELKKIEEELEKICLGPWPKAEPAVEKTINELIERMAGADPSKLEERIDIRRRLVSFGPDAVPYLAKNLTHQEEKVRTMCAEAMAELASLNPKDARAALRHMILVLSAEGVAPPRGGVIAWYQRDFVQALGRALGMLTGIKGVPGNPRSPRAREEMLQFLDWWEKNRQAIEEPQLGEPVIEKSDALYARKMEKIYKLREITEKDMLKLSFSSPPGASPAEVATGRQQKPEDAAIERTSDRDFKKTIPTVSDEDAGGLIRKKDKELLKNFFR